METKTLPHTLFFKCYLVIVMVFGESLGALLGVLFIQQKQIKENCG
jgi:hypothetical protein